MPLKRFEKRWERQQKPTHMVTPKRGRRRVSGAGSGRRGAGGWSQPPTPPQSSGGTSWCLAPKDSDPRRGDPRKLWERSRTMQSCAGLKQSLKGKNSSKPRCPAAGGSGGGIRRTLCAGLGTDISEGRFRPAGLQWGGGRTAGQGAWEVSSLSLPSANHSPR